MNYHREITIDEALAYIDVQLAYANSQHELRMKELYQMRTTLQVEHKKGRVESLYYDDVSGNVRWLLLQKGAADGE